jgi:hypothetical protein
MTIAIEDNASEAFEDGNQQRLESKQGETLREDDYARGE